MKELLFALTLNQFKLIFRQIKLWSYFFEIFFQGDNLLIEFDLLLITFDHNLNICIKIFFLFLEAHHFIFVQLA